LELDFPYFNLFKYDIIIQKEKHKDKISRKLAFINIIS
jgi:hypothetical protein